MGEAKRRKQRTPTYGQPALYTLHLYDDRHELIVSIPMPVKNRAKALMTDLNAVGMAGSIVWYLVNPTDYYWQKVQGAIAEYCQSLEAIPDFATLQEWAAFLPERFWANITRPDGAIVQSRDKDRGPTGDVVMESRENVAPKQEGVGCDRLTDKSFEQMLRAS